MATFLSELWLDELDAALGAIGPQQALPEGAVEFRVDHVTYHLVLSAAGVRARRGPAEAPTVSFAQSRSTAVAVARGQRSAQAAVQAGEISVRGNPTLLVSWRISFGAAEAALSRLAVSTTY